MSNVVKNTLIFVAGGLVGAVGSYVALKTVFDRVLEEQKELARQEAKQDLMKEQAKADKPTDKEDLPFPDGHKVNNGTLTPPEEEQEIVNYRTYYNSEGEPMEDIERIDFDSFQEINGFEKRFITYDENHEVFLDEYDELMEGNVLALIGEENLGYVGEFEESTLYIRNHKIQTDFEISVEYRLDDND